MSKPYDVGYGKPPIETQFQKGESGNPAGRPKKSKSPPTKMLTVKQALVDALVSPVTITENGKKKEITSLEALVRSSVMRGIQGDKALAKFIMGEAKNLSMDDFAGERLFTYKDGDQTHYLTQSNMDAMEEFIVFAQENAKEYMTDDGEDKGDVDSNQEGDAVAGDESFNPGNGDPNEASATNGEAERDFGK